MKVTDLNQLEYLHDAFVDEIAFMNSCASKNLKIQLRCDDDCGYPDWAGKALTVNFSNILRVSSVLLGHVDGQDIVGAFTKGVSEDMQQSIQKMSAIGISAPKIFLMLTLQSGSEIEIACDEISISLD